MRDGADGVFIYEILILAFIFHFYTIYKKIKIFNIGDRAHLLHSAYALSFAGLKTYDIPAFLSTYMEKHENDYVPWKVFFWHLTKLATVLEHRSSFKDLRVKLLNKLT